MKPIHNYRTTPLDYPNMTPRQHAVWLYDRGVDWTTACQMAGLNEIDEMKETSTVMIVALAVLGAFLLAIAFIPLADAKEASSDVSLALAECLNGKPIRVGTEYFVCTNLQIPR